LQSLKKKHASRKSNSHQTSVAWKVSTRNDRHLKGRLVFEKTPSRSKERNPAKPTPAATRPAEFAAQHTILAKNSREQ
jgi:hypothetical protein